MTTFREKILRSNDAKQLADAFQMVTVPVQRDEFVSPLRTATSSLQTVMMEAPQDTATVTSMQQIAVENAQSQLRALEASRVSLEDMEARYKREVTAIRARIENVMSNNLLKWNDQQDTVVLLCDTIMEIRNMYLTNIATWQAHLEKEEKRAAASLSRIHELLLHAKEPFAVESAVRAEVRRELEQSHREQVAQTLLNDGILIWVSRSNEASVLMTQAKMNVADHRLTIEPTQLCLAPDYLPSIQEKYHVSPLDLDFGTLNITIDLRDVVELQFLNRLAVVPGAADKDGLHYEIPQRRICVHVKTKYGREYWLADRKNEVRGRTWASIQEAQDGSTSLLYKTLLRLWEETRPSRGV